MPCDQAQRQQAPYDIQHWRPRVATLCKDRFPQERKSKLRPHVDGAFKVLARYNNNAYKINIPRDKYSVSDIFNIKDLSPYHGDEDFDPRTDLPQGRGDDAEHPKVIPMDLPTSTTTPLGPMTRARARALETEVTSLLSQFHFDEHEAWLLPHMDTLCILRYNGEANEQGQEEEEDGREDEEEEGLQEKSQPPDDRSGPDVRRLKHQPSPSERTSGLDRTTGAPEPEANERTSGPDRTTSTPASEPTSVEVRRFRTSGTPITE